jgi:molybdenum cofactor cytidylyltransferase
MITHVVDALLASSARPVIVVTGHEAEALRTALSRRDVIFVHNPDYADGLSTSLKSGLAALPEGCDGVLVCLGDMPKLRPLHINRLIAAFNPAEGRAICVPTSSGERGNPVLWGADYFAEMQTVKGDIGAKHLIGIYDDQVCEVVMEDDAVLRDIDTPQALADLEI